MLLACVAIESESTNLQFCLAGLNQLLIDTMEASKEIRDLELSENDDVKSTDSDSTLQSEHYHQNESLSNAPGLLVKTIEALNNKLKLWGKAAIRNLSTILSAFELLSALSEYICEMLPKVLMLEKSREVVRHLCFYIQNSIKRPKVEHKRTDKKNSNFQMSRIFHASVYSMDFALFIILKGNCIPVLLPHLDAFQNGYIFMTSFYRILHFYIILWKFSNLEFLVARAGKTMELI